MKKQRNKSELKKNDWNRQDNTQEQKDTNEYEKTENDDQEDMSMQFDDEEYERLIFVQNGLLYNLQDKAGIPSSRMF